MALQQEEPRHRGLARRSLDERAGELGELFPRSHPQRVRFLHELPRPAGRPAVQLVEEVLLAVEVTVDAPFRHARFLRDERRRGPVVSLRGEELQRGAHEALVREVGLTHRPRI